MGDCLLCPAGDRHVPDHQLADHMRIHHPDADPVPLELWPDGGLVVDDQALEPGDFHDGNSSRKASGGAS